MGSLTQKQKAFLTGSLLGDAYLRVVPGRKNAFFEFNHSIKQKDYVDWKFQKLAEFVKSPPKSRKGNGGRIAYRFFTRQNPYFTKLHKKFYKNKKKIIPEIKLDSLVLAVWFMDDGTKNRHTYYLNTQQFSREDQKKLTKMLKEQYNIIGTLNKDKQYYRIRIANESSGILKEVISRHIIPSMLYKLE